MSLLFRAEERAPRRRPEERMTISQYAEMLKSAAGYGSLTVSTDSALRHDAVWSCVTRIAQDVSMMPVDVVRYQGDTRVEVSPTPQVIAAPSVLLKALDWRYQVVASWLTAGNAWGIVTQTTADMRWPLRIELRADADVHRFDDGSGRIKFTVDGRERELWPVGDLWHVPAYTLPGSFIGLSPIAYHRVSIAAGLEAERFGGQFFVDGAHPTALITPPGDPGADGAKSLKERVMEVMRGSREPLVLPKDTGYQQLQVNPDDSQFIETMRYSVEQVCRIFGEDPADHGASSGGSSITYANRSDADLARLKRRQFWITKLQECLTDLLPRPQVVKLNTSASLMMTEAERWQIWDLRLNNKTTSINRVLSKEDEKPFEGAEYDEPGIPGGAAAPVPEPAPADTGGAA